MATPTDIVTLVDAKTYLQIPAGDVSRDFMLSAWIAAATPVIEGITGPIVPRLYDEWYDGGQHFIALRHRPVIELVAVSEYRGPIEYPLNIISSPDRGQIYSVQLDGSRVVRRSAGGGIIAFPAMPQSVHVVYEAGQSTIPQNVWLGTLEFIRDHWIGTQTPGGPRTGSEAAYGVSSDIAERESPGLLVSPRVREMLAPNRRHPRVA
jgi:hypothetical protein